MHVERRTRLQPVVKGPLGLPYVCSSCGIRITGTSFPLYFAPEVHFDPWGLHGPDRPVKRSALVTALVTPMQPA